MTLRARLTAAFLAVVLGPVLLGAVFVGLTVASVERARSAERLDVAVSGVRTTIGVTCQKLRTAAETAALLTGPRTGAAPPAGGASAGANSPVVVSPPAGPPDPGTSAGDPSQTVDGWAPSDRTKAAEAASRVVHRQLASAVTLVTVGGATIASAGALPAAPWADCSWPASDNGLERGRYGGLSSRVEISDANGAPIGYAVAVDPIDVRFVALLAAAGGEGTAVGVLGDKDSLSTERGVDAREVAEVARELAPGTSGQTTSGRFVRRLDPETAQPLVVALSVAPNDTESLFGVLVAVVLGAGLIAVATAWLLARSTAKPLTELSIAVDRVAEGDLAARVPVRSSDEVGRLGATFNRMAREMQGYVLALTASRDQLRGQLGVLGDTLSSTHDLNRILQVILQTATAATGAQAGLVLLVDQTSGVLVGQCAEGLRGRGAPADVSDLRLRVGEGLLGGIAASGEPRRGRVDRDGPALAPGEPNCLTYIAVPLAVPAAGPTTGLEPPGDEGGGVAARGVLVLYDRHGFDEFDDSDLVTLRTFAGQAAVALDNVRVHEEAQRLSLTDALTGLSNYRYLRESLRREVERASRFGHTLAVLVLDLDHFKEINDTYGHAAGDAVLAEFARRVRAEIREVDFAFRQGGEEFVVLLPETDGGGAEVVAQRLGEAVRRAPVIVVSHQTTRPLRVSVTVSVGAAVFPYHGETGLAVLEAADDALYAAKAAGRDTFRMAGATSG